jgi:hypothetical protein
MPDFVLGASRFSDNAKKKKQRWPVVVVPVRSPISQKKPKKGAWIVPSPALYSWKANDYQVRDTRMDEANSPTTMSVGDRTDEVLLERYTSRQEEAAFAALVRRYSPLVLSVCRRALHHEQDAEDAFQAVFCVLARKAASIRQGLPGPPQLPRREGPALGGVGSFRGNGINDIVVANGDSNTVSVLLGNGDGSFQPARNYSAGTNPYLVAVGDFQGNGILDIAVADYGDTQGSGSGVSVLLGNGDGTFRNSTRYSTTIIGRSVAVVDFYGDGIPVLAVTGEEGTTVLRGNGDGTFQNSGGRLRRRGAAGGDNRTAGQRQPAAPRLRGA